VVRRQVGPWRGWHAGVVAPVVCLGGIALFDVVNPRILTGSSLRIALDALGPALEGRLVVLDYPTALAPAPGWEYVPKDLLPDPKLLHGRVIARFAAARPLGYVRYDGGALPASELAAAGQDLIVWSRGLDQDYRPSDAVCRQWPAAEIYELWDEARRGRAYVARVGGPVWAPDAAADRWARRDCPATGAAEGP
jgi:hypothetical protein